jgi:hypothetical protein
MAVRPLQYQEKHQRSGGTVMQEARKDKEKHNRWIAFVEGEKGVWLNKLEKVPISMLDSMEDGDNVFRRFLNFARELDSAEYLVLFGRDGRGCIVEVKIWKRK